MRKKNKTRKLSNNVCVACIFLLFLLYLDVVFLIKSALLIVIEILDKSVLGVGGFAFAVIS